MVKLPKYRIVIDCEKDGTDVRTFVQCERPCGGMSVGMIAEVGLSVAFFSADEQRFVTAPPMYRAVMFHTHGDGDRIDFIEQGYNRSALFDMCDLYATQIQAVDPLVAHKGLYKGIG